MWLITENGLDTWAAARDLDERKPDLEDTPNPILGGGRYA